VLPEGNHFTGGNEVTAEAFFDWKSATASTIVSDGFLTLDFVSPIDFGDQRRSLPKPVRIMPNLIKMLRKHSQTMFKSVTVAAKLIALIGSWRSRN